MFRRTLSHATQIYDIFSFKSNYLLLASGLQTAAQKVLGGEELGENRAHHAILGAAHQGLVAINVAAAFPKCRKSRGVLISRGG